MSAELRTNVVASPLGPLRLTASRRGLARVDFVEDGVPSPAGEAGLRLDPYADAVARYFDGDAAAFDELALDPRGGTRFQRTVWRALQAILYGETRSYKWLAERVGRPNAFRAVGQANGRNPLPVVVPCHRVIASSGKLGGYTGGRDIKRALLAHEGVTGL